MPVVSIRPKDFRCDECKRYIEDVFYDSRTPSGRWGNFCPKCWPLVSIGKLGCGYGQKYELMDEKNGMHVFEKTAG